MVSLQIRKEKPLFLFLFFYFNIIQFYLPCNYGKVTVIFYLIQVLNISYFLFSFLPHSLPPSFPSSLLPSLSLFSFLCVCLCVYEYFLAHLSLLLKGWEKSEKEERWSDVQEFCGQRQDSKKVHFIDFPSRLTFSSASTVLYQGRHLFSFYSFSL